MSITLWTTILVGVSAIVLAVVGLVQHKWWVSGCVIVAIICLVIVVILQEQDEYEEHGNDAKFAGILTPGTKYSIIPEACKSLPSDSIPVIALGRKSGAFVTGPNTEMLVFIHHHSYVAAKTQNGNLLLTAKVFDGTGKMLISITDNSYVVDGNNVLRDLVPSDHTLSVFDLQNRPIFHVDFRNPLNIYITGTFTDSNVIPLTIMDNVFRIGGGDVDGFCVSGGRAAMDF